MDQGVFGTCVAHSISLAISVLLYTKYGDAFHVPWLDIYHKLLSLGTVDGKDPFNSVNIYQMLLAFRTQITLNSSHWWIPGNRSVCRPHVPTCRIQMDVAWRPVESFEDLCLTVKEGANVAVVVVNCWMLVRKNWHTVVVYGCDEENKVLYGKNSWGHKLKHVTIGKEGDKDHAVDATFAQGYILDVLIDSMKNGSDEELPNPQASAAYRAIYGTWGKVSTENRGAFGSSDAKPSPRRRSRVGSSLRCKKPGMKRQTGASQKIHLAKYLTQKKESIASLKRANLEYVQTSGTILLQAHPFRPAPGQDPAVALKHKAKMDKLERLAVAFGKKKEKITLLLNAAITGVQQIRKQRLDASAKKKKKVFATPVRLHDDSRS